MCSSSCWACYAWFGVYFIIEAPIRGKPSCARPRGPKASHQRKLLTAVKFWISDFWGANWYLYCPLGPVPRLTSSPQPRWRICQITLLGDMSAAGLRWWLGAELSVTEFGNGTTDPPPFHRSRCSGNSWREKGEDPASTSITSAFQGGGRGAGGEARLTMGTRQKAESLATGAGEPEPRFPARRAGHPGGAPVGGRPCI